QGDVHHQRDRTRGRQPAPTVRRRVLRRRQGQDAGLREAALLGARHSLPRVMGRVRLRRERHPARPRRPPPQDAGDGVPEGVLVQTNAELTSTVLSQVMSRRVAPFKLLVLTPGKIDQSIYETLARDHFKNPDEALVEIYRRLRPGDPPTVESARALFRGMFMD